MHVLYTIRTSSAVTSRNMTINLHKVVENDLKKKNHLRFIHIRKYSLFIAGHLTELLF